MRCLWLILLVFTELCGVALRIKLQAKLLTDQERNTEEWALRQLEHYSLTLKQQHIKNINANFEHIKTLFRSELDQRTKTTTRIKSQLKQAPRFLEDCF